MLVEETSVPSAALPVVEFKAHLRLGSGFADENLQDSVLESFLLAAMAAIEARTGKILIERDFSWTLTRWRDQSGQVFPVAPVQSIQSVTLVDRMGDVATVAPSAYRLEQDMQRPRLRATGACLPQIPTEGQSVVVFAAGFGAGWGDVPIDLRQAVMLLGAHYYEYRSDTALKGGCMPFGVTSLIERYRPVRVHMGSVQ
jgi:uncharacterized phiE125 gp8 family phage protein